MWHRNSLLYFSLLLTSGLLLAPKIILIEFFSYRWVETGVLDIALYLLQDVLLVVAFFVIAATTITRNKFNFYLLSIASGALLLFLLVDMRVRELWLKPLDWQLIRYSLQNASNLTSGAEVFLTQAAGFGHTFRFIVFVLFLAYLVTWSFAGLATYIAYKEQRTKKRQHLWASLLVIGALLIGSIHAKDARYHLNENIVVSPLVTTLRSTTFLNAAPHRPPLPFEQPAYPLTSVNDIRKLQSHATPDFKNLVFIILESVRWNSVFAPDIKTAERYPTFDKLSREGMLFKTYVSVPHSSKGYHAILTGLHAYPDIEIKEAMYLLQPSVIHELKNRKNMEAVAFSSLYLQFENMEGFLKSIGVSNAYAVSEITHAENRSQHASSFGESDEQLFSASISYLEKIKKNGQGFIALYFPSAAHYPYQCSQGPPLLSELEKYEDCIARTDSVLGEMLTSFDKQGLLDSTLFVLVGDHGESFGEHGLFIHNASMHEEEVTVPLIFWAKEKSLPKPATTTSHQIDVAPTVADFFGVIESPLSVQGISLLREHGKRTFFMSTFFDQLASALVEHPYKYIYEFSSDTLTKYNIENDPQEKHPQRVEGDEFVAVKSRLLSYNVYQKALFAKKPKE
ncbi:LTA synthase family protein [Pseudomonas sp. C5pp]|uniref:LTA synthase family protein n=1 Tax=Pseudomonas sp. C5pp TaxID=1586081 RepID=UPI00057CFC57|nr:sulfatase-like hydrolase/transferase [Pseudomonas sp. C5pp]KIC83691.1 sulfatase [Pseudomonas sp. C5pp]